MDKWMNELRKKCLFYFHPVSFTFLREWDVCVCGRGGWLEIEFGTQRLQPEREREAEIQFESYGCREGGSGGAGAATTCRIEVRRAQPLPQAWRVSLPSLTRQCERFWQAPIIPSLSQMVGSGIDIPKALKSSQMLCCHSLNNRGRNKGGKNWCWLLILLMLLKTAPMLQFWNGSPLPLKACCVIDCHLSPASRRASWLLSAKASDLHVFFWHLTNGNSLQICINSLCLTNNQGLHSVDAGNISSDTKEWEAGGWGGRVTENKSANNGCFNEEMNVTFWFRGKSFEVIFVFQQATANGAKSVC